MTVQLNQIHDDAVRDEIGSGEDELLDNQTTLLNARFREPIQVSLSDTVITIGPGTVSILETNGSGGTQTRRKLRLPQISNTDVDPVESTIDIADGDTTEDFSADPELGESISASKWVKMGLELRSDSPRGKWYVVWGTEGDTLALAGDPLFSTGAITRVVIGLENDGTPGTWNFETPLKANLEVLPFGGAGGGGGVFSNSYLVTFTAESQKDVNVGAHNINAQKCIAHILDVDNNYEDITETFKRTAPDANTVRLATEDAETLNLRVLVFEVQAGEASGYWDVTFTNQSQKDIDTSEKNLNAEKSVVRILDKDGNYEDVTETFRRTAPDANTVRLNTEVNEDGNFRVLVKEVE